jgi:hypothetical protein
VSRRFDNVQYMSAHGCRHRVLPAACIRFLGNLPAPAALQVRVAALGALVPLAQTLPSNIKRSQVLPLIRRYMQPLELEPPLQRLLAGMFAHVVAMVGEIVCARSITDKPASYLNWFL